MQQMVGSGVVRLVALAGVVGACDEARNRAACWGPDPATSRWSRPSDTQQISNG